jgi:ornithine carbamoyltransferase
MRHFVNLSDWSSQDLWQLIQLAVQLKAEWKAGGNQPVLQGKTLGMVFQKPSLRTRASFDVAMYHLGGYAIMLGPDEIGLGKRESIGDIARVLSGYVQGIMARVFDHDHVEKLAQYASVPVINGLSDESHPCQVMADMLTIYEHFGTLKGLKLAFIGDGNNVAASLAIAAAKFGMHYSIATPVDYELPAAVLDEANGYAAEMQTTVETTYEPEAALENADVIYTDTWVSMGQEAETARRLKIFEPFQVNAALLSQAKKDAVVLHCLPAHRGQEITDEVADGPQSLIFPQAENRLHAQKAILVQLMA